MYNVKPIFVNARERKNGIFTVGSLRWEKYFFVANNKIVVVICGSGKFVNLAFHVRDMKRTWNAPTFQLKVNYLFMVLYAR